MIPATNLFEELRGAGIASVARHLGLLYLEHPAPGSVSPCPSCHAERRGSSDKRGPIGLHRSGLGFRCHRCKASGDAITLAALALTGSAKPDRDGWRKVHDTFSSRTRTLPVYKPKPSVYQRPPIAEVQELWSHATPIFDNAALCAVLRERHLDPTTITDRDLCRVIPNGALPRWASFGRTPWNQTGHTCLFALHDHQGQLQSLHARRLQENAPKPKGLNPLGFTYAGLCFLEPGARQLFQGNAPWLKRLVIVEGATDFLASSIHFGDANETDAVLGVLSGSWSAVHAAQLPPELSITIATHEDQAGEQFATHILNSLPNNMHINRWRYAR